MRSPAKFIKLKQGFGLTHTGANRRPLLSEYFSTQPARCHLMENVKSDSTVAMRLIGDRNACVLWHDYLMYPGVTRAVDEVAAADADAGRFAHIAGTTLACFIRP